MGLARLGAWPRSGRAIFTKDIIVLEKAVLRSGGNTAIGHYVGEMNPMTNLPGGPTTEEFVAGYLSSSSGWSGIERPMDKYIIGEEFPPLLKKLEEWGLEIEKDEEGRWAICWEMKLFKRMTTEQRVPSREEYEAVKEIRP